MARCEDYPCCGHEPGACPDEHGRVPCARCGRKLPKGHGSSLCDRCHRQLDRIMDNDDPTGQDLDNF